MIRKALEKDLLQLAALFDQYRVFYKKESDLPAAKTFLAERMEKNQSIIYVHETETGLLSGFTQLYPVFSSTRMQRSWLLNDLYVKPEYRGQGLSVALINRAKKLVADTGACGLSLETEKSNVIGNSLYPKTGFKIEENNFYFWSI